MAHIRPADLTQPCRLMGNHQENWGKRVLPFKNSVEGESRLLAHILFGESGNTAQMRLDGWFSPRAKNDGAKGLLVGAQSPVQQSQDAIAFPIPGKDTRRSHCA